LATSPFSPILAQATVDVKGDGGAQFAERNRQVQVMHSAVLAVRRRLSSETHALGHRRRRCAPRGFSPSMIAWCVIDINYCESQIHAREHDRHSECPCHCPGPRHSSMPGSRFGGFIDNVYNQNQKWTLFDEKIRFPSLKSYIDNVYNQKRQRSSPDCWLLVECGNLCNTTEKHSSPAICGVWSTHNEEVSRWIGGGTTHRRT